MPCPTFSIVIPTYNRGSMLEASLRSVFAQTYSDYEVIVVDDGSTDDTRERVARYDRVRLIVQENAGPGASRNTGLRHAIGRYVAFLDSDDLFFRWTLAVYERLIRTHGEPAFVAGCPYRFTDEAELDKIRESESRVDVFRDYLSSSDAWRWYGVSSFVVRTDVLRGCGGFFPGPMNAEDADLTLRIGTAPVFIHVCGPATFAYRSHGGNITADVQRSAAGHRRIVAQEKAGAYPGGASRSRERREIITRHARSAALASLRCGHLADGWRLYRETFPWHVALNRWKFLSGFPAVALWNMRRTGLRLLKRGAARTLALTAVQS